MEAIIRSPSIALETRRLLRPPPAERISDCPVVDKEIPAGAPLQQAPPVKNVVPESPAVPEAAQPRPASQVMQTNPIPPAVLTTDERNDERKADEAEVRIQVEEQVAIARAELGKQVAQAHAQAERDGFAAGLERGEVVARKAVAEQVDRLASIAASLYQAKAGVIEKARDDLVEIAFASVCRILGEGATSPAAVLGMVRKVLAECGERMRLVVRLHPQDLALLAQASGAGGGLLSAAELRADAAIRIGGCIVESETGSLDARLEIQLARLSDTLLAVRKSIDSSEEGI